MSTKQQANKNKSVSPALKVCGKNKKCDHIKLRHYQEAIKFGVILGPLIKDLQGKKKELIKIKPPVTWVFI
jgi:hypothetical protein